MGIEDGIACCFHQAIQIGEKVLVLKEGRHLQKLVLFSEENAPNQLWVSMVVAYID